MSASISTPFRSIASTRVSIRSRPFPCQENSTPTFVNARGWHIGMSAEVCLAALMPAMRATSRTAPLGVRPARIAVAVAGFIARTASATAIHDATLLFVSKQDFQALCLAHPQVALKVLRVVGARLRRLVGIIEELSFTTVRHRLASFLLRLAQKEAKRSAAGVEITLPISNQELASQTRLWRPLTEAKCHKPSLLGT